MNLGKEVGTSVGRLFDVAGGYQPGSHLIAGYDHFKKPTFSHNYRYEILGKKIQETGKEPAVLCQQSKIWNQNG